MTRSLRNALFVFVTVLLVSARPSMAAQAASGPALSLARTVVTQLAEGRFAEVEALFLPPMKAAIPEEKLRAAWSSVVTVAGAFKAERVK